MVRVERFLDSTSSDMCDTDTFSIGDGLLRRYVGFRCVRLAHVAVARIDDDDEQTSSGLTK